jgi:hypothetical protein
MGIKLELLLSLLITAMLLFAYTIRVSDKRSDGNVSKKEMEFTHTTFTEVDTDRQISTAFGSYGVREGGVLSLHGLKYHTDSIERLTCNQGRYVGEEIYLDGNIILHQKKGFLYRAEHAVYNKKTAMLAIPSHFTAKMDQNRLEGVRALYDTRKKTVTAQNVHAVVYTAEK